MSPVGSTNARLLILGSLPGEASLQAQRYYAHPQNQFWRLLGEAIGEDLASAPYNERLRKLAARRIALWDVVGEARRRGSLDTSIRGATPNQLRDYAATHSDLQAIAFNGKTASRLGKAALGDIAIRLIELPSSSPAYTLSISEKAKAWAALGPLACEPEVGKLAP
jgi:TDG/mug DNA glycosylase family protein